MNISQFKLILKENPDKALQFVLPNKATIPGHFHITEIGHVHKDFIDCGGTRRSSTSCLLQAWVAKNDEAHLLKANTLGKIMELAKEIFPSDELDVEVEFEAPLISQFPIATVDASGEKIVFQLVTKHTDCLAKEQCGLESDSPCCSAESGCC